MSDVVDERVVLVHALNTIMLKKADQLDCLQKEKRKYSEKNRGKNAFVDVVQMDDFSCPQRLLVRGKCHVHNLQAKADEVDQDEHAHYLQLKKLSFVDATLEIFDVDKKMAKRKKTVAEGLKRG